MAFSSYLINKKITAIYGYFVFIILCSITFVFTFYHYEIHIEEKEIITEFYKVKKNLSSKAINITDLTNNLAKIAGQNYLLIKEKKISFSDYYKYLKYDPSKKGFHLDALPEVFKKDMVGNLTLLSPTPKLSPDKIIEINMALSLANVFKIILAHTTDSPWLYYTSNDFILLAPFVNSNEFFFARSMVEEKEFYKNGRPEVNPERKSFWTSAYLDEAGKGLMTTYSVPVYAEDKFLGTVSIDVTIDQFNNLIKTFPIEVGEIFIYNSKKQIIASPDKVSSKDAKIKIVDDYFDPEIIDNLKTNTSPSEVFQSTKSYYLLQQYVPELEVNLAYKVKKTVFWSRVFNKTKLFLILFVIGLTFIIRNFHNLIKINNQQSDLFKNQNLLNESQKIANICSFEYNSETNELILSDNGSAFFQNKDNLIRNPIELVKDIVDEGSQSKWEDSIKKGIKYLVPVYFEAKTNPYSHSLKNHIQFISILIKTEKISDNKYILKGIIQDVSERKALEEKLESERVKIINTSKLAALGEMSAGMAHEINNPLAIIVANVNRIKKDPKVSEDEKIVTALTTIENMIKRISKIIKGLRTFARDSENDPYQNYSLQSLIDDTVSICGERMKVNDIRFEIINEAPLHQTIECNPIQISQVLINLISNSFDSIQNLPEKWIKLHIHSLDSKIQFEVSDSGKGINKEIVDKIFQPFFTTKEVGKGTGIGLSISKGLIEAHQGKLYLDPTSPNTKFIIELPAKQAESKQVIA